jgi:DNA-binding transcriptional ArsR family regulator
MNAEPEAEFDAAHAFALLGDETRVAILEALAGHSSDPLSFAELRERTGVDDSGRFNYHLGKLVGRFVEKTEAGYHLTYAGSRVVGAVYEGTYAEGDEMDPIPLDADCIECGAGVELSYADERITIGCSECGNVDSEFGFPPGAVAGRDPETLPAALTSYMTTMLERLVAGFCSNCAGPVSPTVDPEAAELPGDAEAGDGFVEQVPVSFVCDRCQSKATSSLASVLLTEPAVVAFHYDHGIDVREALLWSLPWLIDSETERLGESPPRYAVTGSLDGERLRVVVDGDLEVVETERSGA